MAQDPVVRRSKFLSLVLRHKPETVNITLDAAGWIEIAVLLPAVKMSRAQLDEILHENRKKRFELSPDGLRIRASQGHSVDVELGYEEKTPPETLYHGTSKNYFDSLRAHGILKRERHHVHMSPDVPTARIVARRRPNPIVLWIEADNMAADGFKFYLSTNGVWLTEHVPPKYFDVLDLT